MKCKHLQQLTLILSFCWGVTPIPQSAPYDCLSPKTSVKNQPIPYGSLVFVTREGPDKRNSIIISLGMYRLVEKDGQPALKAADNQLSRIVISIDPAKIEMIPCGALVEVEGHDKTKKWKFNKDPVILTAKGDKVALIYPEFTRQSWAIDLSQVKIKQLQAPETPEKFLPLLETIRNRQATQFPRGELRPGKGWKLHLNFNSQDTKSREAVVKELDQLLFAGIISDYKIGDGTPGKESTVYIGDGAIARHVARYLEKELDPYLLQPAGDSLIHDIPMSKRVMGRFALGAFEENPEFFEYGMGGVLFQRAEVEAFIKSKLAAMPEKKRLELEQKLKNPMSAVIATVMILRDFLLTVDPAELQPLRDKAFLVLEKRYGRLFSDGFDIESQRPSFHVERVPSLGAFTPLPSPVATSL